MPTYNLIEVLLLILLSACSWSGCSRRIHSASAWRAHAAIARRRVRLSRHIVDDSVFRMSWREIDELKSMVGDGSGCDGSQSWVM